jgi:hypothetical protein
MTDSLRDKLIAAEPQTQALRAEHERKVRAMMEKTLSVPNRIGFLFGTLASVGGAAGAAIILLRVWRHLPLAAIGGLAAGAILSLVAAALAARILVRGRLDRDRDTNALAGVIWAFTVILVVSFTLTGGMDNIRGVGMTVMGVVFLIGAAVVLLRTVIERSELHTREKLLELELRLAEISERLQTKGDRRD